MQGHHRFKTAVVRSGLLLLLTNCQDPAIQRLSSIKQTVCACKTLACADVALTAMPTVPARRLDKAQAVASEIFDCYSRLAKADEAGGLPVPAVPTVENLPAGSAAPTAAAPN